MEKKEGTIRAYKGFDKDLRCRGFQYEVGKTYKHEGNVEVCSEGFHACESPLLVLGYYPPATSRYCAVEQSGRIERDDDGGKTASSEIKIGAEIGIRGLVEAHIKFVKARTTTEHTDPKAAAAGPHGVAKAGSHGVAAAGPHGVAKAGSHGVAAAGDSSVAEAGFRSVATAGDSGVATAGFRSVATAGFRSVAAVGDGSVAAAGDGGIATAGDSSVAAAGDSSVAEAGFRSVATAGFHGVATAGDSGTAISRGRVSVGENGCGLVRGNNVLIRGGLGAVLVICEEQQYSYDIDAWKAAVVDGKKIKADTWYRLKGKKLVEVQDAENL